MIRQKIYLPDWDWRVFVFYVVTKPDAKEITRKLESIGCKGADLERAEHSLLSGQCDTGITYTSHTLGESVIVIAKTTTALEFEQSMTHEVGHLANHIGLFYGLNLNGEEVRYISDSVIAKMWPIAKELVCDCCRGKEGEYE